MIISVLSGKGGTGKTTVSACLASVLDKCQYIDCDVEEPNGAIFLNPKLTETISVNVKVPVVDEDKCTYCGICAKACQFGVIAVVEKKLLFFHEICHHCGACVISCPEGALYEVEREIGVVEKNEDSTFLQGKLNVGEPISIPILQKLKSNVKQDIPVIIDCSPGASCNVVESIEGSDYCILVTEPTPFGLHDLEIAVKLAGKMDIPYGVVLNKASEDSKIIHKYCKENDIKILMEIPFSREIAEAYSRGKLPVHENPKWKKLFKDMYKEIKGGAKR
ncbi:MAG TPA: 4Fe-4S binding protein [Thermoanaerobacterales bacterium]|nr:4Fe-4S binding protein [Thermoanaerobacterales bacterium]